MIAIFCGKKFLKINLKIGRLILKREIKIFIKKCKSMTNFGKK
jgi:hypothetical protein